MHDGELDLDVAVIGNLVVTQFPHLAGLPIQPVRSTGTVNAIFRSVTISTRDCPEWRPGPRICSESGDGCRASALTCRSPFPFRWRWGGPDASFPFSWAIYEWIEAGRTRMISSMMSSVPPSRLPGSCTSCAASIPLEHRPPDADPCASSMRSRAR